MAASSHLDCASGLGVRQLSVLEFVDWQFQSESIAQRWFAVRMKRRPSDTAIDACVCSSKRLRASSLYSRPAWITVVSPCSERK